MYDPSVSLVRESLRRWPALYRAIRGASLVRNLSFTVLSSAAIGPPPAAAVRMHTLDRPICLLLHQEPSSGLLDAIVGLHATETNSHIFDGYGCGA